MDLDVVLTHITNAARGTIARSAPDVDATRSFPSAGLQELAAGGGYGLVVPASYGGSGGALAALARACRELGEACASTAMVFLMHCVATATIARDERHADLLRAIAAGEALATLAFSERGTGAHFYSPQLSATRTGGALRISGRKSFVTSGGHADLYVLLVQGEAEGTADAYIVDAKRSGISFEGDWDGLGMAGNSSIAMTLDDVELSAGDRIGPPGGGLELVFTVVAPLFLAGLAAVNVGIAAAATRAATQHVSTRRYPDGSSLAEIQHIQHLVADMDLRTRQAWLLVSEAALAGENGAEDALVAIMEAKIAATEAAVDVTRLALHATGGQGYTSALPIERHLRDAHAGAVMAPTNAVLRSWVGRALAGLPVP